MNNQIYRLSEIFKSSDKRSLVVDTSNSLSLGVLKGLENFDEAVRPLLHLIDGIVVSPGQARKLTARTQQDASFLVKVDWTNAFRMNDFILPPETIQYIPLLGPSEAIELGANSMVMHFILGHDEGIETHCLQRVVNLSLEGHNLGMPLLVDVQPIGPRVVFLNKAIELGVSYAIEGGADGVIIPWPGTQSFTTILAMCNGLPVWIRCEGGKAPSELVEVLPSGAVGFWLDESIFAINDPIQQLNDLRSLVHPQAVN